MRTAIRNGEMKICKEVMLISLCLTRKKGSAGILSHTRNPSFRNWEKSGFRRRPFFFTLMDKGSPLSIAVTHALSTHTVSRYCPVWKKGWESVPYSWRTLAVECLSFRVKKNIVAKTDLEKKKRVFCENERKKKTHAVKVSKWIRYKRERKNAPKLSIQNYSTP